MTTDHTTDPGRYGDDGDEALDAALAAADDDMLAAIRKGLDLGKGLAQILGDLRVPPQARAVTHARERPEEVRAGGIADQLSADEARHAQDTARCGDAGTAASVLRQRAEAGTAEWLLAQLLQDADNILEAAIWRWRAYDDGDIRAAGLSSSAAVQLVKDAGRGRQPAGMDAARGSIPKQQFAVPAMIGGRDGGHAADNAVVTSESLGAPGRDLRVMNRARREETRARIAQLRELLGRCPAGALGEEGSAMVLAGVAKLSETLIADRDERAALRLIRAAFPCLRLAGRRHPAAFDVRRVRASALCELGQCRRAEMLLRRLSEDERQVFGSDDPRTALLLLWALIGSGRQQEAEAGFRTLDARLAQPQDTSTLMRWHLQCRYSWLLGQQGLVSESAKGYDGVIINRSHELGYDHPDALDARHSKGKMLVLAGDGPSAVTLLRPLADDRARVQGDRHPDTLETLKYLHLASVHAEPHDNYVLGRAIDALGQIMRIQDRRHGPGYPMSCDTAVQLSTLFRLREAISSREPIPDLRRVPIPDDGQNRAVPLPGTLIQLPEVARRYETRAADSRPRPDVIAGGRRLGPPGRV